MPLRERMSAAVSILGRVRGEFRYRSRLFDLFFNMRAVCIPSIIGS